MPHNLPLLRSAVETTTKTHCPYCAFQCGMAVTTTAGDPGKTRELTIAADPDFPVNRGQMCIKGATSGALLDHPERLRRPMVRVRARGGRLVEASWDAALDLVAERIQAITKAHGAPAMAAFGSGALTNEKAYLL